MKKNSTSQKSATDWKRIQAMTDNDIDLSDSPEVTPEQFAKAIIRRGLKPKTRKAQLTLRVDDDVFKIRGTVHTCRIWWRKQALWRHETPSL